MRVFERNGHINFVDENDVAVGFDNDSNCCENFGYEFRLNPEIPQTTVMTEGMLADYRFIKNAKKVNAAGNYDEGAAVAFPIFNVNRPEMIAWLVLYNSHNGYYSHGFTVDVGGIRVLDGSL